MTSTATQNAVTVRDLTFRYAAGARDALTHVDLAIPSGALVGIVGACGAGKSSLIAVINGMIPHHHRGDLSGTAMVVDASTTTTSMTGLARHVGTVFQDVDAQFVTTTVSDEVAYGLENFGVDKAEAHGRMARALEMVGLRDFAERSIDSLSGGQKQRVAIASIVAMEPAVLVLDEPTSALDPQGARQVFELLRELSSAGTTVIVAEQRLDLIGEYADLLVVMDHGAVAEFGPTREVLREPERLSAMGLRCPDVVNISTALGQDPGCDDVALSVSECVELVGGLLG